MKKRHFILSFQPVTQNAHPCVVCDKIFPPFLTLGTGKIFKTVITVLGVVAVIATGSTAQADIIGHLRDTKATINTAKTRADGPWQRDAFKTLSSAARISSGSIHSFRFDTAPAASAVGAVGRILDIIGQAEPGSRGYDAVVYTASIQPPKPPTKMTLADIRLFQILWNNLIVAMSLPANAIYNPTLQDRMAIYYCKT